MREIFQKHINDMDVKSKNFWEKYFQLASNTPNISMYDKLNTPLFSRSFGHNKTISPQEISNI